MTPALQIYSRPFDSEFFKLPENIRQRIEDRIDQLGAALTIFSHQRLKGVEAFRVRIGDYRVIYDYDVKAGKLFLLAVGHRREVYRWM